jgi:Leucine-rich repeat (LRR) protein
VSIFSKHSDQYYTFENSSKGKKIAGYLKEWNPEPLDKSSITTPTVGNVPNATPEKNGADAVYMSQSNNHTLQAAQHVDHSATTYHELAAKLQEWVNDVKGKAEQMSRGIAKGRILKAFEENSAVLSLKGLSLTTLPSQLGCLKQLETLDISENSLKQLPPEISNLEKLFDLNISGNQFKQIPPLDNFEGLGIVYADRNPFSQVPPRTGRFVQMETLLSDEDIEEADYKVMVSKNMYNPLYGKNNVKFLFVAENEFKQEFQQFLKD